MLPNEGPAVTIAIEARVEFEDTFQKTKVRFTASSTATVRRWDRFPRPSDKTCQRVFGN